MSHIFQICPIAFASHGDNVQYDIFSFKITGGFFDPYGGGWWKMAAFPLPVTILDDLIFRFLWGHFPWKWPHPIWRKQT